jgi:transposase
MMERVLERCAALDVHKAQVTVWARVPDGRGGREDLRARFSTMAADLLALRDWLGELGVTHVAMESSGVYWKPVYYVLEDEFELLLVNAQHVKNLPGRKTDMKDAEWLCQLLECGLLRASFVPPREFRELRDLTRYRKSLIAERQRQANRLHKVLEDAGVKLSCVATDVLGASGRAMLEALISGTRDPEVLAELARGKLRKKIPQLKQALAGRFSAHHALMVGHILAHLDYLDEAIGQLTGEIEERIAPFVQKAERLDAIPGVGQLTVQAILAELGVDMSRFPTHRHAASWVKICPGNHESAGKRRSGRTGKATVICALPWSRPPRAPPGPRTPICAPNTSRSSVATATTTRSSPSHTRSSSPPTTCCATTSPTTTSEGTTSRAAQTPNA